MGIWPVLEEIEMKAVQTPKSLPWLARRAGVPEQVADALWRKALTLAGAGHSKDAGPCRQAEAMQTLLRMLGHEGGQPARGTSGRALPHAAVCQ
jgi:hypothetical protein